MDRIVAVWPTPLGFSAVIDGWQLDLEVASDGSRSTVDAISLDVMSFEHWRRRVREGHMPATMLATLWEATRPLPAGGALAHSFVRDEPRRIEKDEFLEIVRSFAARQRPKQST